MTRRSTSDDVHAVVVTTFYPNPHSPARAVFIENLAKELRTELPLHVIAPVPFAPPLPRWRSLRNVSHVERRNGISVVHPRFVVLPRFAATTGLSFALSILVLLARLAKRFPRLVVHAHCAYPDAVGVAIAARLLRLPYVVTCHGSDLNVYSFRRTLAPQIRWALRGAARIIAVSGGLQHRATELLGPKHSSRCIRIPCAAVNADTFNRRADQKELRKILGIPLTAKVVIFIGELVPIKGVNTLISAWRNLMGTGRIAPIDILLIVGSGPEQPRLREMASGANGQIHFLGTLSQPQLAQWLRAADLLCLPSRSEGTPNVIIEALACGRAIIGSRVGAIPALVQEGKTGFLVAPGDVSGLADALLLGFAQPWDETAIAATVAEFTWRHIARSNAELLRKTATSR